MSQQTRAILKTYFNSGDFPTEAQFINLIDSLLSLLDDASYLFNDSYLVSANFNDYNCPFSGNTFIKRIAFTLNPDCNLVSITNLPSLTGIEFMFAASPIQYLSISNCAILEYISFPALSQIDYLEIINCPYLYPPSFPTASKPSTVNIYDNINLTEIITLSYDNITLFDAHNCALTSTRVDTILSSLNSNGKNNGTCKLNGGTNGIPSGGITNPQYLALIAKGWTVLINT